MNKTMLLIVVVALGGLLVWLLGTDRQADVPVSYPVQRDQVPAHLQGHHQEFIDAYWDRRAALGPAIEQPADQAVRRIIAYQLNLDHGIEVDHQALRDDDRLSDFGLDLLDVVDLTFAVEHAYDGQLVLPDYADERLPVLTVGDLVRAAEQLK